jgi:ATP-dependent RNA helicase DDX5/DBP2
MGKNDKVIIFCATKKGCERLCKTLQHETFSALPIHGDKVQAERDQAIEEFKNGTINIMVATDVASR